jgi:hypothetical protein
MSHQALRFTRMPFGTLSTLSETITETRSVTTRAREADLDLLERMYIITDRNAVRGFLTHRPFLVPLLFEAHSEIATFFAGAPLRLAVVIDPEDENARHLTLSIMTSLPPSAAVDRLQALDTAWWLDAIDRARGALSTSVTSDEF